MCRGCVKEVEPERGTTTFDTGAYLVNYKGCVKCGSVLVTATERTEVDDSEDGVERVSFLHCCKDCSHEICRHEYSFEVVDEFQEYSMNCMMCGFGSASVSVMPEDPRQRTGELY